MNAYEEYSDINLDYEEQTGVVKIKYEDNV
jgi:hypothetical protein